MVNYDNLFAPPRRNARYATKKMAAAPSATYVPGAIRRVTFPTASGAIEYLAPEAAAQRFAGDPILAVAPPYVAAIRLRVADRAATARFLEAAGVPARTGPGRALQVSSRDAMGAVLEFV